MKLSQSIRQILSNFNSTYDAAQEVALQTGEPLGTVHKRLSQWLKKDPETWVKINQTIKCLGYKIEVKKMQDLKSLPLELYGHGQAKSFQSLLDEIENGESRIIWEENKPIRCLKVCRVKIICLDKELTLYEDRQEFADGRIRQRGFDYLSEKMGVDEEIPMTAAERALKEELGMNQDALDITRIHFDSIDHKEVESPSYPGLLTRYEFHDFIAYYPVEYWREEFREIQEDKTTVFIWR